MISCVAIAVSSFVLGVGVKELMTRSSVRKDIVNRKCRFCGCKSNGFCVFPKN